MAAHDPTFWLMARASGVQAVALLGAATTAGLLVKGRPVRRWRVADLTDVHRFLSLLALLAVAAHGVALVLDSTVRVTPWALVVPGLVPYRPLWTSVGVVTAELMLLVHVSFRYRARIGVRNWRRLHYATYAAFLGAVAHGLMAGSDSDAAWARYGYVAMLGLVAGLTAWRVTSAGARGRSGGRTPPPATRLTPSTAGSTPPGPRPPAAT